MECTFTVNGTDRVAEVEPRELFVDVVRDQWGLTGTKVACDTGQCGSCVVSLNGSTVKSCQVLAVQAAGGDVLTIEGVGTGDGPAGDGLTDLQRRLWQTHGVQCGFCIPGVVMAMRELLAENPYPTEDEVKAGLAGNLCRCTGYVAIVQAVLDETPTIPAPRRSTEDDASPEDPEPEGTDPDDAADAMTTAVTS